MARQIVLLTGTSSGFGFSSALHLAKQGFFVIATMRDLSKAHELKLAAQKEEVTDSIEILGLDVTNQGHINTIKDHVQQKHGKIDILINNAGYCAGGMAEILSITNWEKQLQTNIVSVVAMTKAFLPMMRKERSGKIINIGSISGRFGFPGLAAYTTSKFALSGFSESLRIELLPFSIYVSLIEAGSFKTEIWEKSLHNVTEGIQSDYEKQYLGIYEAAKQSAKNAEDPQVVIQLIEKICATRKPKFRYQVGKGVKTMLLAKAILPWSIVEKIIVKKLQ